MTSNNRALLIEPGREPVEVTLRKNAFDTFLSEDLCRLIGTADYALVPPDDTLDSVRCLYAIEQTGLAFNRRIHSVSKDAVFGPFLLVDLSYNETAIQEKLDYYKRRFKLSDAEAPVPFDWEPSKILAVLVEPQYQPYPFWLDARNVYGEMEEILKSDSIDSFRVYFEEHSCFGYCADNAFAEGRPLNRPINFYYDSPYYIAGAFILVLGDGYGISYFTMDQWECERWCRRFSSDYSYYDMLGRLIGDLNLISGQ